MDVEAEGEGEAAAQGFRLSNVSSSSACDAIFYDMIWSGIEEHAVRLVGKWLSV